MHIKSDFIHYGLSCTNADFMLPYFICFTKFKYSWGAICGGKEDSEEF